MCLRLLPLAIFSAALGIGLAVIPWQKPLAAPRDRLKEDERGLDPLLELLLRERGRIRPDNASPFAAAIHNLARLHGLSPEEYVCDPYVYEGYAVGVRSGRDRWVVLVLRGTIQCIPGRATLDLTLLDESGRPLDGLACDINNRLIGLRCDVNGRLAWGVGNADPFYVEVPKGRGAQLVIRYAPLGGGNLAGNWSHGLTHGGKTYRYHWDEEGPGGIPPAAWDAKGLCRVGIRDGKFAILFPRLAEERLAQRSDVGGVRPRFR